MYVQVYSISVKNMYVQVISAAPALLISKDDTETGQDLLKDEKQTD